MKTTFKIISIIMFLIMLVSFVLFVSTFLGTNGGGFLDLTNVAQYFLCGIIVLSGILGGIAAFFGWRKK